MRMILMLCAAAFASLALGADYEREKRWADEIVPGLVVGEPVYLKTSKGRRFLNLYTETANAKAAVIIIHGRGVHPDMGLIGVLRSRLSTHGYTTLSVQMPVLWAEAAGNDYLPEFPEARERIATALSFLQTKGNKKIALVAHSMGARMSSNYLKQNLSAPLFAWVPVSITNDKLEGLAGLKFPVLDLYGEHDLPQVLDNNAARAQVIQKIPRSVQIMVPKADHFFENQDDALIGHVKNFLDQAVKK